MTVVALLERPNGFGGGGMVGWVDCHDGSIVCDSTSRYFGMFLLSTFFAIVFPIRAHAVIATPEYANCAAFLIAALFGSFALDFLYVSAKAVLVKRALMTIRDFIKPIAAEFRVSTQVERDASLKSGSRPAP